MKILMAYSNLPLMMAPAISVGIFHAMCKDEGVEFKLFETTEYSEEYKNRHIVMSRAGANRGIAKDTRDDDYFTIKDPDRVIPDFIETVENFEPDLILVHMQEDVVQMGLDLLESIKDKNIPHITGGVYAMAAPDMLIKEPAVNVVCRYEGEEVLRQAIQAFKNNQDFTSIDGIWWKDANGSVIKNKPAKLTDITKAIPDFTCYENKRWARPMGGRYFQRAISLETYRGCPYKCSYCNSPGTRQLATQLDLGNFMRRKSADIIERDLHSFIDKGVDPDMAMFIDDSFLARPAKEIFEFTDMWSKYKIPFWFNTRIENCKPEYLAALKEAGAYRMTFGIESGNEEYRKTVLKRAVTNDKYREYFGYINDSDIPYSLNVIIGMPFETRAMVMDTARLVRDARGHDGLTLAIWQPYRGTELRDVAIQEGFIEPDHNTPGTGYLDWEQDAGIKMPKPYLQRDEMTTLVKVFALYAYFPDDMWPLIKQAETDEKLRDELMNKYKSEFFGSKYQEGGKTKLAQLNRYCNKHDESASYQFIECRP